MHMFVLQVLMMSELLCAYAMLSGNVRVSFAIVACCATPGVRSAEVWDTSPGSGKCKINSHVLLAHLLQLAPPLPPRSMLHLW